MSRRTAAATAVGEALGLELGQPRRSSTSHPPDEASVRRRSTTASVDDVNTSALEASLRLPDVRLDVPTTTSSPPKKKDQQVRPPEAYDTLRTSEDVMAIGALSKVEAEFDFAIVLKPVRGEDGARSIPQTSNLKAFYRKHPTQAKVALLRQLHATGLQTKKLRALDGRQTLIKVKAPPHVLELGAEKTRLKKQRKVDGMWVEFASDIRESFADFHDGQMHFLDSEKQSIVFNLLTTEDGAGLTEHRSGAPSSPLTPRSDLLVIVQQMLPLHKADLSWLRAHWVCYWRPAPCPTRTAVATFALGLYRFFRYALDQPLDGVAQYFGEQVAFYFAWLQLYTRWLLLPTAVGAGLFYEQVRTQSLNQPLAPFYALFMAIWASAFLVAWRREANALAHRWGVLGYEDEEIFRPEFYGNRPGDRHYSSWKRWLKYGATHLVVLMAIGAVLVVMYYAFSTRDALAEHSLAVRANLTQLSWASLAAASGDLDAGFWFYLLVTPMLYGLCIPVADVAFTLLAARMTAWENHKTESAFQSALILKVFPFRFVHVFATLYYYAFAAGDNLLRVGIQLATFMLSGQMWHNVVKTGLPLMRRALEQRRKRAATTALLKAAPLGQSTAAAHRQCVRLEQASSGVWDEWRLGTYDTFDDYTEMLIQFGYVGFFSIAFPLAPLLALLNNLVALRADAFKLCHTKQRPIARKASGIGIWFPVLQAMAALAVVTNCLHVAFTTTQIERLVPGISPANKVWVVFAAEHLVLLLQVAIACAVPSMTKEVKDKVRKEKALAKRSSAKAVAAKLAAAPVASLVDDDDGTDSDGPDAKDSAL
ncbi:anoctamin [Achlya hypogyna]|uniref:Anoctamin n=1 Tax=Achlya hypogyna TaxID=1202772 RepID=A0A1V9YGE4_ACHHY|nr:anoctamin [Achlya hypogyna]